MSLTPRDPRSWSRRRFIATGLVAIGGVCAAFGANALAGLLAPPRPAPKASSLTGAVGPASIDGETAGASASAAASDAPPAPRRQFVSRPDLSATEIAVSVAAPGREPGMILFTPNNGTAPDGLLIVDDDGEPVWIRPDTTTAVANFQVAQRHGEPTLAWWEGTVNGGLGNGAYVLVDAAYVATAHLGAGNGLSGDLHELRLTSSDTALLLTGRQVPWPAAQAGSPAPGSPVWEGIIQEVDVATGAVRFEWHSLDHVALSESYLEPPTSSSSVYDYLHLNSIEVDADGSLLVSARNTSTIYSIDRGTGDVRWRLGGKQSDYAVDERARFGWQHDARRLPDGRLSLFDDQQPPTPSRGLILRLDDAAKTATVAAEYLHPRRLAAASQGNCQVFPSGNVFVGWGSTGAYSEFRSDGTLIYDASFAGSKQSYRCVRSAWTGRPDEPPAAAARRGTDETTVYASWNGATDVAAWRVHAGASATAMRVVAEVPRSGFETSIAVRDAGPWFAVEALSDEAGVLGVSPAVTTSI